MALNDVLFLVAAALSALGVLAHEIVGAPKVLRPLDGAGIEDGVVGLHHFSWHVGTVAVIGMIAMYVLAVWHPAGAILALVASSISAGFAIVAISLAIFVNPAVWRTPAPYPWGLVALVGFAGVWLGGGAP